MLGNICEAIFRNTVGNKKLQPTDLQSNLKAETFAFGNLTL